MSISEKWNRQREWINSLPEGKIDDFTNLASCENLNCCIVLDTTDIKKCKYCERRRCEFCMVEGQCDSCITYCEYDKCKNVSGVIQKDDVFFDTSCANCDIILCPDHSEFCHHCGDRFCLTSKEGKSCITSHQCVQAKKRAKK